MGRISRDFNITESDEYLVCAHQGNYALTVFRRDTNSGMLIATDNQYTAPEGVFVDFSNSSL